MFRLMKLLALGLFGYAVYEFIRGMMQSEGVTGGGSQGAFGGGQGAFGGGETGRQAISGPGEGRRVTTSDFDGGSVSHKVGRGVIS